MFKYKPHYEENLSFPILPKLVKAIMSFPYFSEEAERVFSELNINKTKTRNSLHVETCDGFDDFSSLQISHLNTCENSLVIHFHETFISRYFDKLYDVIS